MRISRDDLAWWYETAPTLKWRYAKTMPDWPHSYVVKGEHLPEADFLRAMGVIRTFGEPGKFYNITNVYLYTPDGATKYWTPGQPWAETEVINTATTEKIYGRQDAPHTRSGERFGVYDALAALEYDDRYTSPAARAENEAVRTLLVRHFGAYAPRTLDVGCGTGLLLDMGVTAPGLFTGVDPSQGMLNELIRKHPRVRHLVPARIEDVLDTFAPRAFELVVSLFGSPSYVSPEAITVLPKLSSRLTVLMHYRKGYLPDYWDSVPEHIDASREAARALGGQHARLNQFDVTVIRA